MRIAICDDDIRMTFQIEELIKIQDSKLFDEVDVYMSGEELVGAIHLGKRYDLIYLDVEMTGIDGIETAHAIREWDKSVLLIYISSYEHFAKRAFEVNAFRYLSKPIDVVLFGEYYKQAVERMADSAEYFNYVFKRVHYRVLLSDILYFENSLKVTYIRTIEGEPSRCYVKLNVIQDDLRKKNIHFYRINQSILINPKYVYSYKRNQMILHNKEEFTVTTNRQKEVRELFCKIKGDDIIV